jgi:hypothetical protein
MADYKQLCVELVNELHGYKVAHPNHDTDLINRARAALTEPEPEGPTDEEIASILKAYAVVEPQMGVSRILHEKHFGNVARAVRARLGQ